jgi:hypothetical protein
LAVLPGTLQVTALFDVPVTVAVNCWVFVTATLAALGLTLMLIGAGLALPAQPISKAYEKAKRTEAVLFLMEVLAKGMGVLA